MNDWENEAENLGSLGLLWHCKDKNNHGKWRKKRTIRNFIVCISFGNRIYLPCEWNKLEVNKENDFDCGFTLVPIPLVKNIYFMLSLSGLFFMKFKLKKNNWNPLIIEFDCKVQS